MVICRRWEKASYVLISLNDSDRINKRYRLERKKRMSYLFSSWRRSLRPWTSYGANMLLFLVSAWRNIDVKSGEWFLNDLSSFEVVKTSFFLLAKSIAQRLDAQHSPHVRFFRRAPLVVMVNGYFRSYAASPLASLSPIRALAQYRSHGMWRRTLIKGTW